MLLLDELVELLEGDKFAVGCIDPGSTVGDTVFEVVLVVVMVVVVFVVVVELVG